MSTLLEDGWFRSAVLVDRFSRPSWLAGPSLLNGGDEVVKRDRVCFAPWGKILGVLAIFVHRLLSGQGQDTGHQWVDGWIHGVWVWVCSYPCIHGCQNIGSGYLSSLDLAGVRYHGGS